jgi:nucleotide-binding universal stress UspA family protein
MQFGDILVCIDESASGRKRTDLALALAARSHARVLGYHLAPRRGRSMEDFLDASEAATGDTAATEFERQLSLRGLDGTWVPGNGAHKVDDLVDHARCVDLVIAGLGVPDDPASDPQDLDIERLIVDCGRPVLGIPIANVSADFGQNIMLAWDGSRESTRAVHDAIPFLREAATIRIVSIDGDPISVLSPGTLVHHLKRLGITAAIDTELDMQLPIGDEILSRIEREEVDLLVAGAFGRSRMWERLFGGTSRTLLHQMMVPVLASH